MAIPKIIHYIWFGKGELTDLAKKCIASWEKYCPDYKIMLWNEDNFDVNSNLFTKQAYENKKYAFVSDYVRLYALIKYGGIYMDTDVEVIKPLDDFLNCEAFTGFETLKRCAAGIMGGAPNLKVYKDLIRFYDRPFIKTDGALEMTPNPQILTEYLNRKGAILNNTFQIVDGCTLYPTDYFYPKGPDTEKVVITKNTHTIHHYSYSWADDHSKKILARKRRIFKIFPKFMAQQVFNIWNHICKIFGR